MAGQGKPIYEAYCTACHGKNGRDFEGKYVGFVTPIKEIGTDPYRLNNYTEILALNMATTYAGQKREQRPHTCPGGATYRPRSAEGQGAGGYGGASGRLGAIDSEEDTYRYKHYRKTNGYARMPVDGIWLRAPYLHNGSVPSLRDLLKPPEERPRVFYRGYDVYDPVNVGFIAQGPEAMKGGTRHDVSRKGNRNHGHKFGTELSAGQKDDLIEYLKTL